MLTPLLELAYVFFSQTDKMGFVLVNVTLTIQHKDGDFTALGDSAATDYKIAFQLTVIFLSLTRE